MRQTNPRLQSPPVWWDRLRQAAREMRREPTRAEELVWQALRRKRIMGVKFRRQHALGPFIVDFYAVKPNLVIEIDGPIHAGQSEVDAVRQSYLEACGVTVLRFSNDEVHTDLDVVLSRIEAVVRGSLAPSTEAPSPRKERGLGERFTPGGGD